MQLTALQEIAANFEKELQDSKAGKSTSLPFIINELPASPLVEDGETFQVMGMGGSIFRSALITKTPQGLEVRNKLERSHPIFSTKDILLEFITDNLHPRITKLAINFAQALDPVFENGKLDGKLAGHAKEHNFEGLMGEKVCAQLEKYVKDMTGRSIQASIGNDTICLMLSGLTQFPAESLAAGIVGTGMNFAIFLDATHAVNLEAASFDKFTQSTELQTIDNASEKPGFHPFEKEVSGAYLHEHFNIQLKDQNIKYPPISSTQELDSVIRQEIPTVSDIALDVMHTSAEEVAAIMAGIQNFYGKDVTFVMQGSLFWKGYDYKDTVEQTMKDLSKFTPSFVFIENADYLGAAKLIA